MNNRFWKFSAGSTTVTDDEAIQLGLRSIFQEHWWYFAQWQWWSFYNQTCLLLAGSQPLVTARCALDKKTRLPLNAALAMFPGNNIAFNMCIGLQHLLRVVPCLLTSFILGSKDIIHHIPKSTPNIPLFLCHVCTTFSLKNKTLKGIIMADWVIWCDYVFWGTPGCLQFLSSALSFQWETPPTQKSQSLSLTRVYKFIDLKARRDYYDKLVWPPA